MARIASFVALFIIIPTACVSTPRVSAVSEASIVIHPDKVQVPLCDTLFGMNITTGDKANMTKPEVIERVKKMGIKSCRFPNGCEADLYNWKTPASNQATVDDLLMFCDAIDAEAYYTINMQGGTEGLKGPAPQGSRLDETIKYQHLMPNPCGYTNYYYGTLAETLELVKKYTIERALAGKRPILHYEMGNENWGQSRTDWPPEVYAKTVEVYAKAMRDVLEDAKKEHPELVKLNLYIVAVGYPVMGNNMKMVDTPDRTINVAWTGGLNKLHSDGVIDAVQEHYYPYGNADGGTLVWTVHNLHNIIYARKGLQNPRLAGYKDAAIAYNMPMEHTEWNVKCWGPTPIADTRLVNGGFEQGLEGWTVKGDGIKPASWAARRGSKGLRVDVGESKDACEISQALDKPEKAKIVVAGVWVRTANPGSVNMSFRQVNDGPNKGKVLGEWRAKVPDMWQRVTASARMLDDTTKLELVISVDKSATVYVDEAKLYYINEDKGLCPISATTFEQQLFCADALREMALGGSPRAHLHHLIGNYPCGTMTSAGEMKDNARVFEFFAGCTGSEILRTDTTCENYSYYSSGNPWATDFNALAPDQADVPMLSSMVSRKEDMFYIFLLNRTSDREINVKIDLGTEPAEDMASVRVLSGEDIDVAGAKITEGKLKVARIFLQKIEPYSAQIIAVKVK